MTTNTFHFLRRLSAASAFAVFLVAILAPHAIAASETMELKEAGYNSERKIVARVYARDISEAERMPVTGGRTKPVIAVAARDLNGDGKPEIIAQIEHQYFCGNLGCMTVILSQQADGNWTEIASVVSQGEVIVHDEFKNNYRTISFDDSSKRWAFQNGKYR